jgi:imidazolonepropionase-like amidohydrolase
MGWPMKIVLAGGQLLDVRAGRVVAADVAIVDGLIDSVGQGLEGDTQVDCSGVTLLPGLIDCHAHMAFRGLGDPEATTPTYRTLEAVGVLRRTLQLGVTTVRDAWGADAGMRDAIEEGLVDGPRLIVSLAQLCGTGGIGDHFGRTSGVSTALLGSAWLPRGVFDGVGEARGAVRRMVRAGADVIKVAASGSATRPDASHRQIADDELAEVVAEATRHERYVMAHAHGARAAEAAARAGVRSIEHGFFLDEAAVDAMLEAGTWLVPTLSAALSAEGDAGAPDWAKQAASGARRSMELAIEAGIPIAMGTDCPVVPHEQRLRELRLMRDVGMGVFDVWRSATLEAARLLDRDDLGALEPGSRADVVAISGDVTDLDDLETRIVAVWKDGTAVPMDDRTAGL